MRSPKYIPIIAAALSLKALYQSIREKMREMGELSGVPIEPPEQTQLLDACAAYAGVIAGGVPGAGGYDAVWLLVCDPPSCDPALPPVTRVEHLWGTWAGLAMAPLSAVESLGPGARTERLDAVVGLHAAIAQ
jgi:phosphomevalonate kinase